MSELSDVISSNIYSAAAHRETNIFRLEFQLKSTLLLKSCLPRNITKFSIGVYTSARWFTKKKL